MLLMNVIRNIFKSFKHMAKKFTMTYKEYKYLEKSREQIRYKDYDCALKTLQEGSKLYPNNLKIRIQLVELCMILKDWKLAIEQYQVIFDINTELNTDSYILYAKVLQYEKKFKQAEKILNQGLISFPNNQEMIYYLADNLTSQKKWSKAVIEWERLFALETEKKFPVRVYSRVALVYRKLGAFDKGESILLEGINYYNNNKKINILYADMAIYKMNWNEALQRLQQISKLYSGKLPMNIYIKQAMIYQIIGKLELSSRIFNFVLDNYQDEIDKDNKGYRKIIFFNNGESRIEFYKKLKKTETAIVTFDSLNMVWKNPPFGFKLLIRQDVDIIAVRKKKPNATHQDLSIAEFYNATNTILNLYKNKLAYGYSLGGYTSLYYGSSVNCKILSLAPRLSIHPKYGKQKGSSGTEFKHSLSLPYNADIEPIIVYDSKEKQDNTFVKCEVRKAFPNTIMIDIPYGGHGIAPHLLRMGLLKDFILSVINNEIPKYDRSKKSKSNIYLRVLGQACLKRKKLNWANDLANKSLELLPTDKYAIKLKVNVLKTMEKYDEALEYVLLATDLVPEVLEVREFLIDLYLHFGDINNAENELNIAVDKFGESDSLGKLRERIVKFSKKIK